MARKSSPIIQLYNLEWETEVTPVAREVFMIRGGGQWSDNGQQFGNGLFYHYRELQTLLWPQDDHHEWSDLILKTILGNRITAILGPKDCSKTRSLAKFGLTDYFCFPRETLTLLSSTDIRGLELRVWGDLKDLFNRAKEVWPEAPGHILDSSHGIFTDELTDDGDARDMRRGLICIPCLESNGQWKGMEKYTGLKQKRRRLLGDECFPEGSMILMEDLSRVDIKTIIPGDMVMSAIGPAKVTAVSKRKSKSLIKLVMKDGRQIVCTLNHPILTAEGWKNACEISQGQFIVGLNETMQAMRENDIKQSVLRCALFESMDDWNTGGSEIDLHSRTNKEGEYEGQTKDAYRQSDENRRVQIKSKPCIEKEGLGSGSTGREWNGSNKSRISIAIASEWRGLELWNKDRKMERQRISSGVQSGHCLSRFEIGSGSRWEHAQLLGKTCAGFQEDFLPSGSWVDSVEILQQIDLERYGGNETGVTVYNLEVEGHHTYCVNGLVVHNCQFMYPPYITTLANLNKGDFKGVFVGNPIGEGDPLDKISEPMEGWDSLDEITVTTTWKNRMNGVTINLVGTDSPAIKNPGKYTYLIGQEDLDYIEGYWGKDSAEWWNQAMGLRRPGVSLRRVVTRDMVRKFGAQEPVIWGHKPTTKGYAIDASYGGDRCIGGPFEFGQDINGFQVISFGRPAIIPIKIYPKSVSESQRVLPEDQIAEYVKADCERLGIPAANVFHDATGRGSLGTAFARLWRHDTNPIEFGGNPTDRPVTNDLLIYDEKTRAKRLKRCDEHYSKFVTELWFSVRYVIEGGQSRDLPNESVEELCAREWISVRGDKKEVEKKEDMKKRFGRSPDIGDWTAICVEGARRLGFIMSKMTSQQAAKQDDAWKDKLRKRSESLKKSYELTYSS